MYKDEKYDIPSITDHKRQCNSALKSNENIQV